MLLTHASRHLSPPACEVRRAMRSAYSCPVSDLTASNWSLLQFLQLAFVTHSVTSTLGCARTRQGEETTRFIGIALRLSLPFLGKNCRQLNAAVQSGSYRTERDLLSGTVPNTLHCNLSVPEFFLILAHPVHKMWIIQEPSVLELWNKLYFEGKKRRVHTMFKIFGTYICWINI